LGDATAVKFGYDCGGDFVDMTSICWGSRAPLRATKSSIIEGEEWRGSGKCIDLGLPHRMIEREGVQEE
jgi:hypothetical protein